MITAFSHVLQHLYTVALVNIFTTTMWACGGPPQRTQMRLTAKAPSLYGRPVPKSQQEAAEEPCTVYNELCHCALQLKIQTIFGRKTVTFDQKSQLTWSTSSLSQMLSIHLPSAHTSAVLRCLLRLNMSTNYFSIHPISQI